MTPSAATAAPPPHTTEGRRMWGRKITSHQSKDIAPMAPKWV